MKFVGLAILLTTFSLAAIEREEDFKEQDRIFKNCQTTFQAEKYEQNILESVTKENAKKYISNREKAKIKPQELPDEDE